MRKRLILSLLLLGSILTAPAVLASKDDEAPPTVDARLEGYKEGNGALKDPGGTSLTWLLLVVLTGMCVGVMFINSKRSHLD